MAKTAAQEFLDNLLARIPEGEREQVRSQYQSLQDRMAADQRSLEERTAAVTETANKQKTWWDAHKDTVAENQRLKEQVERGTGTVDPKAFDERLDGLRNEVMGNGLALISTATSISASHLKEFGEALNMEDLANRAIKANMTLQAFYDQSVSARRTEVRDAARAKEIADAEARGRKAGVEETTQRFSGQQLPFPSPNTPSVRTLDGLAPRKAADGTVAAKPTGADILAEAVATANAVMQSQG